MTQHSGTQHQFSIGIDVGGTNTDAILLDGKQVRHWIKQRTTSNVTDGIVAALHHLISTQPPTNQSSTSISHINIGTTHFINAVIQRRDIVPVSVIRICGPCTNALHPYAGFPQSLACQIQGRTLFVNGGYNFDGTNIRDRLSSPTGSSSLLNKDQILNSEEDEKIVNFVRQEIGAGCCNFAIVGIFSSVRSSEEVHIAQLINKTFPRTSVTLSNEIGSMGFIERENATILNESLKPLAKRTFASFQKALIDSIANNLPGLSVNTKLYVTQNDGTLLSLNLAKQYPIRTFSAGATNSMRGASFLTDQSTLLVVDVGGTSSDGGVIIDHFPKPSSTRVDIGGVATNFTMPDVCSTALGGGSVIRFRADGTRVTVGPESVGLNLLEKSQIFGGDVLTLTDIAVLDNRIQLGDKQLILQKQAISPTQVELVWKEVNQILEKLIETVRISSKIMPVLFVGGGASIVLSPTATEVAGLPLCLSSEGSTDNLVSVSQGANSEGQLVISVANALGAALSDISATYDSVVDLTDRQATLAQIKEETIQKVCSIGAKSGTVRIVDISEVNLPYLPGFQTRVVIKAVGELQHADQFLPDDEENTLLDDEANETLLKHEALNLLENEDNGNVKIESVKSTPVVINGSWTLTEYDVNCIAVGAGILGCGGGGNPSLSKDILLNCMKLYDKAPTLSFINTAHRCGTSSSAGVGHCNCFTLSVGFMGAPTICTEKIGSLQQINAIVEATKKIDVIEHGKELSLDDITSLSTAVIEGETNDLVALVCAEIGGGNSLVPLIASLHCGLPVLDYDGMGRAFPELQMFLPFMVDPPVSPVPAFLSDEYGNVLVQKENLNNAKDLENHFRVECFHRGCSSGIGLGYTRLDNVSNVYVPGSYSRAWHIGHAVLQAHINNQSPVQAICGMLNGKQLVTDGKVVDVARKIDGGWTKGHVTIEVCDPIDKKITHFQIDLQNEYLAIFSAEMDLGTESGGQLTVKQCLACVPDLISIIDKDSGQAIMTDEVRYGLRVHLLVIPAPLQLTTERSLKVVGPAAFGYSHLVYRPCGQFKEAGNIL